MRHPAVQGVTKTRHYALPAGLIVLYCEYTSIVKHTQSISCTILFVVSRVFLGPLEVLYKEIP